MERALIARRVEGVYEESNLRLSALAGFDAGALGYAVPGGPGPGDSAVGPSAVERSPIVTGAAR